MERKRSRSRSRYSDTSDGSGSRGSGAGTRQQVRVAAAAAAGGAGAAAGAAGPGAGAAAAPPPGALPPKAQRGTGWPKLPPKIPSYLNILPRSAQEARELAAKRDSYFDEYKTLLAVVTENKDFKSGRPFSWDTIGDACVVKGMPARGGQNIRDKWFKLYDMPKPNGATGAAAAAGGGGSGTTRRCWISATRCGSSRTPTISRWAPATWARGPAQSTRAAWLTPMLPLPLPPPRRSRAAAAAAAAVAAAAPARALPLRPRLSLPALPPAAGRWPWARAATLPPTRATSRPRQPRCLPCAPATWARRTTRPTATPRAFLPPWPTLAPASSPWARRRRPLRGTQPLPLPLRRVTLLLLAQLLPRRLPV